MRSTEEIQKDIEQVKRDIAATEISLKMHEEGFEHEQLTTVIVNLKASLIVLNNELKAAQA